MDLLLPPELLRQPDKWLSASPEFPTMAASYNPFAVSIYESKTQPSHLLFFDLLPGKIPCTHSVQPWSPPPREKKKGFSTVACCLPKISTHTQIYRKFFIWNCISHFISIFWHFPSFPTHKLYSSFKVRYDPPLYIFIILYQ